MIREVSKKSIRARGTEGTVLCFPRPKDDTKPPVSDGLSQRSLETILENAAQISEQIERLAKAVQNSNIEPGPLDGTSILVAAHGLLVRSLISSVGVIR